MCTFTERFANHKTWTWRDIAIAEFFLQYIENNQTIDILTKNKIIGYFRYVDDILILYDHTVTDISTLLNEFNRIHPNLYHTLELEKNNQLNFLDINLTRTDTDFKFSIYKKPSYTDVIIPYNSCHPTQHKLAALRYFTNRLNTYPLEQTEKDKEKTIIQNIAHNNGFPTHVINKLISKPPTQKRPDQITKKWATLTYFGKESYHISKIFKNTKVQISFKTRNNLQYLLNQKPKQINIYERCGVYQLTCRDCKKLTLTQDKQAEILKKDLKNTYRHSNITLKTQNLPNTLQNPATASGKKTDILQIKFIGKKSKFLDTMEKYYIYQETKINNQINDKNTVSYNKIFEIYI
jgi:hypothetical protein